MLDNKALADFKEKLLKEKSRLEKDLEPIAKQTDGDYQTTYDDLGRGDEENAAEIEEYTNNMGVTETLEKNLREIEEALQRIENGTYGICENCNEEIALQRLEIYPSAKACVTCSQGK